MGQLLPDTGRRRFSPGAAAGSGLRGSRPAEPLAGLSAAELSRLVDRIDSIPLFAHAYAHHLNLRFGGMSPRDLLAFATCHQLIGVKIHVEDGGEHSLLNMSRIERHRLGRDAAELGLRLHVETSSTTRPDLEAATAIASDIAAESIRCYPRYEGRVSDILRRTIEDLQSLPELDLASRFSYTLEQHEDLKSHELVKIIRSVDNPHLSLLFDFGNMTNAYEAPGDALKVMSPLVTEVHIKDVQIIDDRGGWAHRACRSGEGDIDFHVLLRDLLLLGENLPQVTAYALEEENGMYAPAYRFPAEPADPFIPARDASLTGLPHDESLDARLVRERNEAEQQVHYVRNVLKELRANALKRIDNLQTPSETLGTTSPDALQQKTPAP